MIPAYETLVRYWGDTGSGIVVAARDEEEVAALEAKYALRLPDDFRAYLLKGCPAESNLDWDNACTEWWELSRIKTLRDEYEHGVENSALRGFEDRYIFFADAFIWCWAWAICCAEGERYGHVALINGAKDPFVATSFTAFVEQYVADPNSVSH